MASSNLAIEVPLSYLVLENSLHHQLIFFSPYNFLSRLETFLILLLRHSKFASDDHQLLLILAYLINNEH
jgi:hypothetical protein